MIGAVKCLFLCVVCCYAYPEQGEWKFIFDKNNAIHGIGRSMYKDTGISISAQVTASEEVEVTAGWMLRYTPCADEYTKMDETAAAGQDLETLKKRLITYYQQPDIPQVEQLIYPETVVKQDELSMTIAHEKKLSFPVYTKDAQTYPMYSQTTGKPNFTTTAAPAPQKKGDNARKKRAAVATEKLKVPATTKAPKKPNNAAVPTTTHAQKKPKAVDSSTFVRAWEDGMYLFILQISPNKTDEKTDYKIEVTVRMTSKRGRISAMEWPLLVFYGVMGLVYIIYGILWIILLACNWRDLLRVQFWIGGVIVLGMLEKAVFFGEYESIAKTGVSVRGALVFAELVSAMKRALARMLVIIVSLGFGIIRPRLGQALTKVLGVGGLYFVLAAVDGCMRASRPKYDQAKDILLIGIPLSVLDAGICWWIFSSLVQTTRTLRLRRNIVKLSLYRHFTNTLIFAILASIAFMIWSITQHKFKNCLTDWKELWVDDAFWHLLFCVILAVIMVLWRPTINNQRYAFSPLLDAADDEDEEDIIMNDAFDGMKLRGGKLQANGSPKQADKKSPDDDLKWVEENIPTSIIDKALPSLLDSDEEVMTTKFEMSKMD